MQPSEHLATETGAFIENLAGFHPSPPPAPIPVSSSTICSRWRRAFAFLLDALILAIPANLLCSPFFEQLSRIGTFGALIGFFISIAYFGMYDSRIGHGRTPGKRLLHISVVDRWGGTLSVEASFLRAAILSLPSFLNGISLPVSKTPMLVQSLLGFFSLALTASIGYLLLFNRQTGQGLHDLAAGSYVVYASEPAPVGRIAWRRHGPILASIMTVLILAMVLTSTRVMGWGVFPALLQDVASVESVPGVERAGVRAMTMYGGQGPQTTALIVTVNMTDRPGEDENTAYEIARRVMAGDPKARAFDSISIVVVRGYDIGIASSWRSQTFRHTPAEWE